MKISRELWARAEPMLEEALDLAPAAREAWLAKVEAAQPDLAPVLRRLIASHDGAERSGDLETVGRLAGGSAWSATHAPGETIGPFRLLQLLGHGGMGEVWLARQVDGRVEREVALKLPALHGQAPYWRERFRRERDILARLEHPRIARLYDAGVTEAGQPWLAMEYVEGPSLAEHVARHMPAMPQRLAIFRQVLDAVAHAHRHLVVHRDLKPGNILVDGAGQVKLLDFGIAKFGEEEGAAPAEAPLTRLGGRLLTLRYAAPEQLAGESISTATDIYALGVILHELATGVSPYRAAREGRPLTESAVLAQEPALPSSLTPSRRASQIRGDLDAIILKAMRREPGERYASVGHLDEDIARHLDRRPVKARAGTWRYLAGRFAIRHKLPIATAAGVLVALMAGLAVAEMERRQAEVEKARAERHFASVRKLANTFIFDVHAQLETLPGSLKAREALVKSSLEYLDALAGETGNDPALTFELGVAYRTIANVQGQIRIANLGDPAGAIRNYEKAQALFTAAEAARPTSAAVLREHWKVRHELARSYYFMSDARWSGELAAALSLAQRLAALPGATLGDRAFLGSTLCERAHIRTVATGFDALAEADIARGVDLVEALVREAPSDIELRKRLATCRTQAGNALSRAGAASYPRSIEHLRRARELKLELSRELPADGLAATLAAAATAELAAIYGLAGEQKAADAMIGEALALNAGQRARDPANVELRVDRLGMLQAASRIAYRLGERHRSIGLSREALAIPATLPEGMRRVRDVRSWSSEAKIFLAFALLDEVESGAVAPEARPGTLEESRRLLAEVMAYIDEMRALNLVKPREDVMKEVIAARARCERALARLAAG